MPTPQAIRTFVLSGHGDFETVKSMLAEDPDLLNSQHQWGENDYETALTAAAHVGNKPIAEYLLSQGAPMDICVAAMLGRKDTVAKFLRDDPALANAKGAHQIPLLFHIALGGDTEIADIVKAAGGGEGANYSLIASAMTGNLAMTQWLLDNGVMDVNHRNFQDKTPFTLAEEGGHSQVAELLRKHGGVA